MSTATAKTRLVKVYHWLHVVVDKHLNISFKYNCNAIQTKAVSEKQALKL